MFSFAARRSDADACPGALRLHTAADGPLARIRLPGGRLTGAQLRALRELAEEFGDGQAELTSRANLQLRALTDAPVETLAARLRAASLLPSDTHDLIRNILASPMPDCTAPLPVDLGQLDRSLCADPELVELPGRFLFALDTGALDVAAQADVAAVPATALGGPPGQVAILLAGTDPGLRVPTADALTALLTTAHAFLTEQTTQAGQSAQTGRAWRVRELVDGPVRVAARAAADLGVPLGVGGAVTYPGRRELIGLLAQPGGLVAVGAAVPLGRLSGVQMKVLEEADAIVVTPWHGVLLPDLTPAAAEQWARALAGAGLEVNSGSHWAGVTACAGRPGCAKALADVRADATAVVRAHEPTVTGRGRLLPVHWVGCARGCGSPAGAHVRVEANGWGYTVQAPGSTGSTAGVESSGSATEAVLAAGVGELVAAARRI